VVEGHPEGGNRLIIGTSKVRSQNGPCQGAGRANARVPTSKKRISNIEQGMSNFDVPDISAFEIPSSIFEIFFLVL